MKKITYACTITLVLVSSASYAVPISVQPIVFSNKLANDGQLRFTPPPLPPSGTPIGRRRGAAGRGKCALEPPLTALMPATEQAEGKVDYVWAKTSAKYPTFWFYVPYSTPSLRSIEFVLQDEQDNDIYRTPVKVPQNPGIVSFRLPSTATPLAAGKMYHWFFKINVDCNQQQQSEVKDYVEGWVQRVNLDPNLTSQLQTATPQRRIALYAANGIWQDALTESANLRLVNTENTTLQADWAELLQSAGLGNLALKPIVQCCTLKKQS